MLPDRLPRLEWAHPDPLLPWLPGPHPAFASALRCRFASTFLVLHLGRENRESESALPDPRPVFALAHPDPPFEFVGLPSVPEFELALPDRCVPRDRTFSKIKTF